MDGGSRIRSLEVSDDGLDLRDVVEIEIEKENYGDEDETPRAA
jgi:hypothetical protein